MTTLIDTITEKLHDESHLSDSDNAVTNYDTTTTSSKSKINRLFGREKPVHKLLGGGKSADIFLWRDKKVSAGALGVATAVYVVFELLEYHLLTLVCHGLILALALLFLWSNVSTFVHKSPPCIPDVCIPEELVIEFARALTIQINSASVILRDIASGKDLKKLLIVVAGLWVLSAVGSWFSFLTLFYIAFVLLHTVTVVYERYEDQVDALGEKAMIEIKKQYKVLDEKVLSKIPKKSKKA